MAGAGPSRVRGQPTASTTSTARPAWARTSAAEKPQPGRSIRAGNPGDAQPFDHRPQREKPRAFKQTKMPKHHGHNDSPRDPRLQGVDGRTPALGCRREQDQDAQQDKSALGGDEQKCSRASERIPILDAALRDGAPIEQQRSRPQRHGKYRRAEIRCRYGEHENADHEQHRHSRVRPADNRAAKREHAPVSGDHADLGERIDAEQSGGAKSDLRKPVSERRAEIAVGLQFVTDREYACQFVGRRRVEQHRHSDPQHGLRQRRQPEHQQRP